MSITIVSSLSSRIYASANYHRIFFVPFQREQADLFSCQQLSIHSTRAAECAWLHQGKSASGNYFMQTTCTEALRNLFEI